MANPINTTDEIIDSRDVIARIEELEAEREALSDAVEECQAAYDFHNSEDTKNGPEWDDLTEAIDRLAEWDESEEAEELRNLQALAEECEGVPDWIYGAQLIREDYFTTYIENLIDECYEMPKQINSGDWPWRHMTIDYEAAADEAKVDYTDVTFDGETYFVRAV